MRFIALCFLCALLFGQGAKPDNESEILEVKALRFFADENKGIIELHDNVEIKKGQDELYAQKVIINVDSKRTPTNYSAYGGVKFVIITQDNRKLHGKANEVFYNAQSGEYRLVGEGEVREENKINVITGDEIILNNTSGYVNIIGNTSKPAKLIFQMEQKDE